MPGTLLAITHFTQKLHGATVGAVLLLSAAQLVRRRARTTVGTEAGLSVSTGLIEGRDGRVVGLLHPLLVALAAFAELAGNSRLRALQEPPAFLVGDQHLFVVSARLRAGVQSIAIESPLVCGAIAGAGADHELVALVAVGFGVGVIGVRLAAIAKHVAVRARRLPITEPRKVHRGAMLNECRGVDVTFLVAEVTEAPVEVEALPSHSSHSLRTRGQRALLAHVEVVRFELLGVRELVA